MEIFHQQLIFFLALKWSNSSGNAKKFLHIGKKIFFVIYAFPKPSGSNTGILCLLTAPGNNNEVTTIERNIENLPGPCRSQNRTQSGVSKLRSIEKCLLNLLCRIFNLYSLRHHSHTGRPNIACKSFISVLLRQLSYAIKNQLKAPKAPY